MKTLYYYLAIALFATCLVACEKKPVPEPEPEKKNEYTAGQVTKEIKSAAFYYSEESHGYTIHLFDSATPNFQDDDFNRSTYYTVNAFTFDIHANGIGAKTSVTTRLFISIC